MLIPMSVSLVLRDKGKQITSEEIVSLFNNARFQSTKTVSMPLVFLLLSLLLLNLRRALPVIPILSPTLHKHYYE